MARKRYSDEGVLKLLREIDVHLHDGLDVVSACRKPQSTNAFKKALDKLINVCQSRTASGMQWHGIQPVGHL